VAGISRKCGSGEVEGVVDFREEEALLVCSFEYEAAEIDNLSDCFPDEEGEATGEDLGFRDVVVETEGAVESCRREVTLVSVTLVGVIRLVGSAANRVLGRRGDFGAAVAEGLVTFSTALWGSDLAFARRASVLIFLSERVRTYWASSEP
jgi:hypothetical protein